MQNLAGRVSKFQSILKDLLKKIQKGAHHNVRNENKRVPMSIKLLTTKY